MVLQMSSVYVILKFSVFFMHIFNPSDKRWKKCKFLFDSGLGRFAAENIDIVLTENAENPFIAIILIVSLISLRYKLEIVRKKRKIFSEYRKKRSKN